MRIKVLSGGRKNIELPLSDAELNFQMRRIGIEETVPICRLVEVSEQDNPLHKFEGQTVNMDEVNFFAKRMKSMTEYERKVLSAYAEDYGVATIRKSVRKTVKTVMDIVKMKESTWTKAGGSLAWTDIRHPYQQQWTLLRMPNPLLQQLPLSRVAMV